MLFEKLIFLIKSTAVMHIMVSLIAGIVSFVLAEEERSFRSFVSEIIIALFVGLFIASPIAHSMNFSDQLTIAFVAIMAVTARRVVLFIKTNYNFATVLQGFIKK